MWSLFAEAIIDIFMLKDISNSNIQFLLLNEVT